MTQAIFVHDSRLSGMPVQTGIRITFDKVGKKNKTMYANWSVNRSNLV